MLNRLYVTEYCAWLQSVSGTRCVRAQAAAQRMPSAAPARPKAAAEYREYPKGHERLLSTPLPGP